MASRPWPSYRTGILRPRPKWRFEWGSSHYRRPVPASYSFNPEQRRNGFQPRQDYLQDDIVKSLTSWKQERRFRRRGFPYVVPSTSRREEPYHASEHCENATSKRSNGTSQSTVNSKVTKGKEEKLKSHSSGMGKATYFENRPKAAAVENSEKLMAETKITNASTFPTSNSPVSLTAENKDLLRKSEVQNLTRKPHADNISIKDKFPDTSCNKKDEYPDTSCNKKDECPDTSCNKKDEYPDTSCNKKDEYPDTTCNKQEEEQRKNCVPIKRNKIAGLSFIIGLKQDKKDFRNGLSFDCVLCKLAYPCLESSYFMRRHIVSRQHVLNVMMVENSLMYEKYKNDSVTDISVLLDAILDFEAGGKGQKICIAYRDDYLIKRRNIVKVIRTSVPIAEVQESNSEVLKTHSACSAMPNEEICSLLQSDFKNDIGFESVCKDSALSELHVEKKPVSSNFCNNIPISFEFDAGKTDCHAETIYSKFNSAEIYNPSEVVGARYLTPQCAEKEEMLPSECPDKKTVSSKFCLIPDSCGYKTADSKFSDQKSLASESITKGPFPPEFAGRKSLTSKCPDEKLINSESISKFCHIPDSCDIGSGKTDSSSQTVFLKLGGQNSTSSELISKEPFSTEYAEGKSIASKCIDEDALTSENGLKCNAEKIDPSKTLGLTFGSQSASSELINKKHLVSEFSGENNITSKSGNEESLIHSEGVLKFIDTPISCDIDGERNTYSAKTVCLAFDGKKSGAPEFISKTAVHLEMESSKTHRLKFDYKKWVSTESSKVSISADVGVEKLEFSGADTSEFVHSGYTGEKPISSKLCYKIPISHEFDCEKKKTDPPNDVGPEFATSELTDQKHLTSVLASNTSLSSYCADKVEFTSNCHYKNHVPSKFCHNLPVSIHSDDGKANSSAKTLSSKSSVTELISKEPTQFAGGKSKHGDDEPLNLENISKFCQIPVSCVAGGESNDHSAENVCSKIDFQKSDTLKFGSLKPVSSEVVATQCAYKEIKSKCTSEKTILSEFCHIMLGSCGTGCENTYPSSKPDGSKLDGEKCTPSLLVSKEPVLSKFAGGRALSLQWADKEPVHYESDGKRDIVSEFNSKMCDGKKTSVTKPVYSHKQNSDSPECTSNKHVNSEVVDHYADQEPLQFKCANEKPVSCKFRNKNQGATAIKTSKFGGRESANLSSKKRVPSEFSGGPSLSSQFAEPIHSECDDIEPVPSKFCGEPHISNELDSVMTNSPVPVWSGSNLINQEPLPSDFCVDTPGFHEFGSEKTDHFAKASCSEFDSKLLSPLHPINKSLIKYDCADDMSVLSKADSKRSITKEVNDIEVDDTLLSVNSGPMTNNIETPNPIQCCNNDSDNSTIPINKNGINCDLRIKTVRFKLCYTQSKINQSCKPATGNDKLTSVSKTIDCQVKTERVAALLSEKKENAKKTFKIMESAEQERSKHFPAIGQVVSEAHCNRNGLSRPEFGNSNQKRKACSIYNTTEKHPFRSRRAPEKEFTAKDAISSEEIISTTNSSNDEKFESSLTEERSEWLHKCFMNKSKLIVRKMYTFEELNNINSKKYPTAPLISGKSMQLGENGPNKYCNIIIITDVRYLPCIKKFKNPQVSVITLHKEDIEEYLTKNMLYFLENTLYLILFGIHSIANTVDFELCKKFFCNNPLKTLEVSCDLNRQFKRVIFIESLVEDFDRIRSNIDSVLPCGSNICILPVLPIVSIPTWLGHHSIHRAVKKNSSYVLINPEKHMKTLYSVWVESLNNLSLSTLLKVNQDLTILEWKIKKLVEMSRKGFSNAPYKLWMTIVKEIVHSSLQDPESWKIVDYSNTHNTHVTASGNSNIMFVAGSQAGILADGNFCSSPIPVPNALNANEVNEDNFDNEVVETTKGNFLKDFIVKEEVSHKNSGTMPKLDKNISRSSVNLQHTNVVQSVYATKDNNGKDFILSLYDDMVKLGSDIQVTSMPTSCSAESLITKSELVQERFDCVDPVISEPIADKESVNEISPQKVQNDISSKQYDSHFTILEKPCDLRTDTNLVHKKVYPIKTVISLRSKELHLMNDINKTVLSSKPNALLTPYRIVGTSNENHSKLNAVCKSINFDIDTNIVSECDVSLEGKETLQNVPNQGIDSKTSPGPVLHLVGNGKNTVEQNCKLKTEFVKGASKIRNFDLLAPYQSNVASSLEDSYIAKLIEFASIILNLAKDCTDASFSHIYIVGKENQVSQFADINFNSTIIYHNLSNVEETDYHCLMLKLQNIHPRSMCCLVFELPIILQKLPISQRCLEDSCESPVSVSILKSGSSVFGILKDITEFIKKLSKHIHTFVLPLHPSRIYCDNTLKSHEMSHTAMNYADFIVDGLQSICVKSLKSILYAWNTLMNENHENYKSSAFMSSYRARESYTFPIVNCMKDSNMEWMEPNLWMAFAELGLRALCLPKVQNDNKAILENSKKACIIITHVDDSITRKFLDEFIRTVDPEAFVLNDKDQYIVQNISRSLASLVVDTLDNCVLGDSTICANLSGEAKYSFSLMEDLYVSAIFSKMSKKYKFRIKENSATSVSKDQRSSSFSSESVSHNPDPDSCYDPGNSKSSSSSTCSAEEEIMKHSFELHETESERLSTSNEKEEVKADDTCFGLKTSSKRYSRRPIVTSEDGELGIPFKRSKLDTDSKEVCSKSTKLGSIDMEVRKQDNGSLYQKYIKEAEFQLDEFEKKYELFKEHPKLYPDFEIYYENFVTLYLKNNRKISKEHMEKMWNLFWASKFEQIKEEDWKELKMKLLTGFKNKVKKAKTVSVRQDNIYSLDSILALFERLNPELGRLGPAFLEIVKECREKGINTREAYEVFTQNDNVLLINMVLDKLSANCKSSSQENLHSYAKAINWIHTFLKSAKVGCSMPVDVGAIAMASAGKDSEFTLNLIKAALVYEGITTFSEHTLNELLYKVKSFSVEQSEMERTTF